MIYKPPKNIRANITEKISIFLAGSIEMGKAEDWQTKVGKILSDKGFNVYNPRRDVGKDETEQLYLKDQVSKEVEETGELKTVFLDGKLTVNQSLSEIRQRLNNA